MNKRVKCPICAEPHDKDHRVTTLELQLAERTIAFMKHVCCDCISDLVRLHGFQPLSVLESEDVVLNLRIAGMISTYGLFRVGSRAKGEPN
jgi:hypothetical protein